MRAPPAGGLRRAGPGRGRRPHQQSWQRWQEKHSREGPGGACSTAAAASGPPAAAALLAASAAKKPAAKKASPGEEEDEVGGSGGKAAPKKRAKKAAPVTEVRLDWQGAKGAEGSRGEQKGARAVPPDSRSLQGAA